MMHNITVYGASKCGLTHRTQNQLRSLSLGFEYVNVDSNPVGKEEAAELTQGELRLPIVVIEGWGTRILREPDEVQLLAALEETRMISDAERAS
jgi:glutaredoxin